jgi:hypothetical protein
MFEPDADSAEIYALQKKLQKHGISREELDLGNYAGLTYTELNSIVKAAIAAKEAKKKKG